MVLKIMKFDLPTLPIQAVLPELVTTLQDHTRLILAAEPGSGKTTIVPLALLDETWLCDKKILLLEPRRLAVRMTAKRMSQLCGESVGGLIGYRIRFETKVSKQTRIEVITEGILTRMIQHDPELTGVGLVIFDEFHERTLTADLGLALCHDVQELRGDLKMMIMSATMDNDRISRVLGNAPVINGHGRCFPVEIHYLPRPSTEYLVPQVTKAIHRILAQQDGDILVFLPGANEIKQVQAKVEGNCVCLPLYGNLPGAAQDLVFQPTTKRRVILATPIAETSLTIEGITVVIDSGLMKTPTFSTSTGLTSLRTVLISKASADQRGGRAGRLCPGVCYRLWTKGEHHSRPEFSAPEIMGADLASILLETLQWGVSDPRQLTWIDPPRQSQIDQAITLLTQLEILNTDGKLTKLGSKIATLPLHPRLGLMLYKGKQMGQGWLACILAALLQNRDIFRSQNNARSRDIEERLELLCLFEQGKTSTIKSKGGDPDLCRKILQEARQYQRLIAQTNHTIDICETGNLLALAYPDRIAMRKKGATQYILSSGRGVLLNHGDHLHHAEFLVVASLDGGKKQGRIFLAAPLSRATLQENHHHLLNKKPQILWNKQRVDAVTVTCLGKLELHRAPLTDIQPEQVRHCVVEGIQQEGIACLNWQKKSRELQARMQTLHLWQPNLWHDVSDQELQNNLAWLEPYLDGIHSLKQLRKLDISTILLSRLSWKKQQELERLAPSHLRVPSGSWVKLTYQANKPPILAVRIQELFGATTTPTIFAGKQPVLIHLLSPAQRPIQVTLDLEGFWKNTYHAVKKELKGRYPKHYWPDNPLTATPTSRVKSRK